MANTGTFPVSGMHYIKAKYYTITEGTVQRPPFNNTADHK